MTTITKTKDRTLNFSGMQEGHAVIIETLSYTGGGVRQRTRTIIGLTPEELRKILALTERAPK